MSARALVLALVAALLVACASTAPAPRAAATPVVVAERVTPPEGASPRPLPVCDVMGEIHQGVKLWHAELWHPHDRALALWSEPARSCGIPNVVHMCLEVISALCGPPFLNVMDRWEWATQTDYANRYELEHYDAAYYKAAWQTLLDSVRGVVHPACVFDPSARAGSNPRFAECPMPTDLRRPFLNFVGTQIETDAIKAVPAGLYAFVSALAAYDTTTLGRMVQLKLLMGAFEAEPVDLSRVDRAQCTEKALFPRQLND